MALMDSLLNAAAQALGGKDENGQNSLTEMAMNLVQQQGGVGNLINQLQQGGLGDVLNSWVSNQQSNLPVSGSDLQNALGSDAISQVAQKFGLDSQQAGDMLAQILPNLVDKATPIGARCGRIRFGRYCFGDIEKLHQISSTKNTKRSSEKRFQTTFSYGSNNFYFFAALLARMTSTTPGRMEITIIATMTKARLFLTTGILAKK